MEDPEQHQSPAAEEDVLCRICLQTEPELVPSPCACTTARVHPACLRRWRLSGGRERMRRCEICRQIYIGNPLLVPVQRRSREIPLRKVCWVACQLVCLGSFAESFHLPEEATTGLSTVLTFVGGFHVIVGISVISKMKLREVVACGFFVCAPLVCYSARMFALMLLGFGCLTSVALE